MRDRGTVIATRFTSVIRKNWPAIVARVGHIHALAVDRRLKSYHKIWNDPQHSLDADRIDERSAFSNMVHYMCIIDPSILRFVYSSSTIFLCRTDVLNTISTFDRDSDLTLSILTRSWLSSTQFNDLLPLTTIISQLVLPNHNSPLDMYRRAHPVPPSVIPRILRGAEGSTSKLLSRIATRMLDLDKTQSGFVISTMYKIVNNGMQEKPKPSAAFFKPLLTHKIFWKVVTASLAMPDDDATLWSSMATSLVGNETTVRTNTVFFKDAHDRRSSRLLSLIAATVEVGRKHFPEELGSFVKILVRARLFDVLDEVITTMKITIEEAGTHESRHPFPVTCT